MSPVITMEMMESARIVPIAQGNMPGIMLYETMTSRRVCFAPAMKMLRFHALPCRRARTATPILIDTFARMTP